VEDRTIKPGDNILSDKFIPVGSMYIVLYEEYIVLHELPTNGQSYACTSYQSNNMWLNTVYIFKKLITKMFVD
jgi:hypothetical protein